ncbi:MAG: Trm112 family protein [Acidimicrobiia bacterium]
MALIDPDLLEILVCPDCHASLEEREETSLLACTGCGLRYPVRDGIPVMLIEEATRDEDARRTQGS